jgi:hypothetical protein
MKVGRLTPARRVLAGALVVGSLLPGSSALAKEFRPGDLRVCNASRCVSIKSQPVLNALASFYYDSAQPPARAHGPRLGMPIFGLEFPNGYVTGIVAGTGLNRFLSYGVNLGQFQEGIWYRVPARAVAGLGRVTAGLTPLRLTAAGLTDTGTFADQRGATPRSPRGQRPATPGGNRSPSWLLGLVAVAALIALALLTRRHRQSLGAEPPTPSVRSPAAPGTPPNKAPR